MAEAKRRAEHYALPFALGARHQWQGRGTKGRTWFDDPQNLKVTFVFQPQREPRDWPQLSFAAALGLRDALAILFPNISELELKWPNDVLLCRYKIAGILLETLQLRNEVALGIGIGVNLAAHPPQDQLRAGAWPVSDLFSITALRVLPADLFTVLEERLRHWISICHFEGFESLRSSWLSSAYGLGEQIEVSVGAGVYHGVFRGLDEQGHLLLQRNGGLQSFASADVHWAYSR